jgi:hypothetical protein
LSSSLLHFQTPTPHDMKTCGVTATCSSISHPVVALIAPIQGQERSGTRSSSCSVTDTEHGHL